MRENKTGQKMKHASSRQVFEYWNEQRGQDTAPERDDIDPSPIRRALGDTFILGQDAQGIHRFRLAGTRACALFCRELKGTDFLTLWAEAERPGVLELVTAAAQESVGFVAGVSGYDAAGSEAALELLLLPLRPFSQHRGRLLGVLAPLEPPYWLGVAPFETLTCRTVRYLHPDSGLAPAPRHFPNRGHASARMGFTVHRGGRF